jgi:hypothetical protein
VAEKLFGFSAVIAWIMIGNPTGDFCFIHFDAS